MNPTILLIVATVCVAVGYVAGLLISATHSDRDLPEEAGKVTGEPGGPRYDEVNVFRSQPSGPLQVEVAGRVYVNHAQMSDSQLNYLTKLEVELRTWLGGPAFLTIPAPNPTVPPAANLQPLKPENKNPQPSPLASAISYAMGQPTKLPPSGSTAPFSEAKSIVAQIDEILQRKLLGSPYEDRKIRLVEMPNSGVVVIVDQNQYPGIDDVPDAEIRSLIRQSVSEWELRAK
jgi:hypothetical protein